MLHTYPHDYKVIFVGDASMSPYEIVAPGGSVEHFNEEAGQVWMERVLRPIRPASGSIRCPSANGMSPVDPHDAAALGGRMYPLTLEGLDAAMRELGR